MDIEIDGHLNISFLTVKSPFTKDTFTFSDVKDITKVHPEHCKGVLYTRKGPSTHLQANLVKVLHPFYPFNII